MIDWPRALSSFLDEVILLPVCNRDLIASIRRLLRQKQEIDGLKSHIITANASGFCELSSGEFQAQRALPKVVYIGSKGRLRPKFPKDYVDVVYRFDEAASIPVVCDLIILGAGVDQMQWLSEARKIMGKKQTPVICLSESENTNAHKRLIEIGANSIIPKTTHPNLIALRVQSIVLAHQQKERLAQTFQDLMKQANIDPLTGLYNRRYADQYLKNIFDGIQRTNGPFAVLMLDIDKFKMVNDLYGHASGDTVLVQIAKRLTASLREMDLLARVGGEEFLLLLPDTGVEQCLEIAERIRAKVENHPIEIYSNTPPITITVSIGAATTEGNIISKNELVRCADKALYKAKSDGRNCVKVMAA